MSQVKLPISRSQYQKLLDGLKTLPESERNGHLRTLLQNDLFFLLVYGLNRKDANNDWIFERCREVQAEPDGCLDLWAREHYKSTVITFALTIQDILNDPEITIGIFSFNQSTAGAFLRQIQRELENNDMLKEVFPDILWENPSRDAPVWSEKSGLVVKRKGNPKESTVESHGLVDGQPTSKHFKLMVYDDVVTRESVSTPDQIKKTTDAWELSINLGSEGGRKRYIGTRYHANDTYAEIMRREVAKPRIHAATVDAAVDGAPVLMTVETLAERRKAMGPYTFACFAAGTKVLMADMSEKEIQDIHHGDEVVGYTFGNGKRASLAPSKVVATNHRWADAVEITFESGRKVVCTPDHKFWSGRAERGYAPLTATKEKKKLQGACSVYDPKQIEAGDIPQWAAGYLAAFFDADGCITGNTIHFAQSAEVNQPVCDALERALEACDLPYSMTSPSERPGHNDYYLIGGRQVKMRFANIARGCGKHDRIGKSVLSSGTRNIGKGSRDKVVSIKPYGETIVYNIQTETGNYVAEGYAAKNCQMMQNPLADEVQGFKLKWLNYYRDDRGTESMNKYIVVDPASSKKKTSDYTAIFVIGAASDNNFYVLDMVRDRLNLTERADAVFALHRRWKPVLVGYERYGMMGDIEHIKQRQQDEKYHFPITELGGKVAKVDRIRRLIPVFEQGRVFLPVELSKRDYEGREVDLINVFVNDEFTAFPVAAHDDMLDALSRIMDTDLGIRFPVAAMQSAKTDRYARRQRYNRGSAWAV